MLVYAVGTEHPLADPCRCLIDAIGDGRFVATTTTQVIQEFVHVRARRSGRRDAVDVGQRFVSLLAPLLRVSELDLADGMRLFGKTEDLGAFDAVLAATAINAGADSLVSADRGFAKVRGLRAVAPGTREFDSLLSS